jgi:hypothetical protein
MVLEKTNSLGAPSLFSSQPIMNKIKKPIKRRIYFFIIDKFQMVS